MNCLNQDFKRIVDKKKVQLLICTLPSSSDAISELKLTSYSIVRKTGLSNCFLFFPPHFQQSPNKSYFNRLEFLPHAIIYGTVFTFIEKHRPYAFRNIDLYTNLEYCNLSFVGRGVCMLQSDSTSLKPNIFHRPTSK